MRHYNIFNVICDYDRNRYTAFPDMQKSYSTHSIFGAKKKKMVFSRLQAGKEAARRKREEKTEFMAHQLNKNKLKVAQQEIQTLKEEIQSLKEKETEERYSSANSILNDIVKHSEGVKTEPYCDETIILALQIKSLSPSFAISITVSTRCNLSRNGWEYSK